MFVKNGRDIEIGSLNPKDNFSSRMPHLYRHQLAENTHAFIVNYISSKIGESLNKAKKVKNLTNLNVFVILLQDFKIGI
jgi:hypothetical protein